MGKGQKQHSIPQASSNEEGGGDALAGSSLEDYFASHKVSGHVSQHLLNKSDVMAAEKAKDNGDEAKSPERKSEEDDYEDDYESETSTTKAEPSDLAGMTLSDYLQVKEEDDANAQEKLPRAGSLKALPPQLAATGKKVAPTSDVSGMSLDHYLGTSSPGENDTRADKNPSPKGKRKNKLKQAGPALPQNKSIQQPFSVKGSGMIHDPHSNSSQSLSSDEESLTPFQLRQKRKDRVKAKQQRHAGSGSSISKAILKAEAPSTILSVRDREKRKTSQTVGNSSSHSHHSAHHGSHSSASNFQPPLPKLAASQSVRNISHKDHDASSDDPGDEKLPPL